MALTLAKNPSHLHNLWWTYWHKALSSAHSITFLFHLSASFLPYLTQSLCMLSLALWANILWSSHPLLSCDYFSTTQLLADLSLAEPCLKEHAFLFLCSVFLLQTDAQIYRLPNLLFSQISFIGSTLRARQWIAILCSGTQSQWYCLTGSHLQHSESRQQNFGNTLQLHSVLGIDNRRYFLFCCKSLSFFVLPATLQQHPTNSSSNFSAGERG